MGAALLAVVDIAEPWVIGSRTAPGRQYVLCFARRHHRSDLVEDVKCYLFARADATKFQA
jgi:hypothetical protein